MKFFFFYYIIFSSDHICGQLFLLRYKQLKKLRFRFLAGIFFISSATLCLEICLTRYFSISQQYHFAFWVVSIAFLGYGASGSFLTFFKKIHSIDHEKFLSISSLLYSLSIFLIFFLTNAIPFDFIKLSWDNNQIFLIFIFYFFLSIPFLFAGLTISFAITRCSEHVNKIYFSDLFGAGVGTMIPLFIFMPAGDRGVILFISFLALFSSFLFSTKRSLLFKGLLALIMLGEVGLFVCAPSWFSFRISPFKALPVALRYPNAKQIFTKWNSISRVDIIESPAARFAPGLSLLYTKKLPHQLGLSIDGGELTSVTQFNNLQDPALEYLSNLPSSLPYSILKRPRTLIIEPKGGADVISALINNAPLIKVIESNPLIVKIMRRDLASFSGNLYLNKNVQVITGNTRTALIKEKCSFDLITFSLTDIFGPSGTGLYGFGENYLYTVESFVNILNRLSPEGIASISLYLLPPPRQEIRILATWIEALEKNKKDPAYHIMAIRSWGTITYLVKKTPFSKKEIQITKNNAERSLFDLVYYPGIKAEEVNIYNKFDTPLYYNISLQLLSPSKRKNFYKKYLFQVKPVSDNRPFFSNFFKINKIKTTYKALGQKWLPFLNGEFLVPFLLIQSIVIAFILIFLPFFIFQKSKIGSRKTLLKILFYFSLIGMSFMFVEITLIQKFILFLGHPLYSVSIILFSLLFSSGLGSFFSKKILGKNIKKNLTLCLIFCACIISVILISLKFLYEIFIGFNINIRILLTFLLVFPLGFLMGFPFPTGIRLIQHEQKKLIPWAWATNAFSSVVCSITALIIAFWGGYNLVLILAAGGYLLAILFLRFSNHRNETNT